LARLWDDRAMLRRILGLLVPFLGSALAVYLSTRVFDRPLFHNAIELTATDTRGKVQTILIVTVVFGLVNLLVKPVVRLVTFPIRILTFGLFSLVINGAMLLLTGLIVAWLKAPFHVALTPWVIAVALFIGVVAGVVSWIGDKITAPRPRTVVKVVAPPPPPPPPSTPYQQVPQYQPRPQYGPPSESGPQYGAGPQYGGGPQYGAGPSGQGPSQPYGSGPQYR
jgi:putative membrane protein